jgi:hypothetical protein
VPARLRDLIRALPRFGVSAHPPHRDSHWKFVGPKGQMYPMSAHNGPKEEIPDHYLRKLCRTMEISYDELKKHL